MNYWKYPTVSRNINGLFLSSVYAWDLHLPVWWEYWSADAQNSVGQLMYELGRNGNLDMSYSSSGSGAYSSSCPRTFSNFGYNQEGLVDFSEASIKSSLNANRPVYMRGERSTGGHAWVVDGYSVNYYFHKYKVVYYYQSAEAGYTYIEEQNAGGNFSLFHCNWGWDGSGDCWVNPSNFGSGGVEYGYNSRKQIICQIHPKQ